MFLARSTLTRSLGSFLRPSINSTVRSSNLGRVRFYEAEPLKELDALTKKYLQMFGCRDCLDFKKYSCDKAGAEGKDLCSQPKADQAFLNDLRTIILDLQDVVYSKNQVRKEFIFPGESKQPVSFEGWGEYLTSRGFSGGEEVRNQRYLSRSLTTPLTVGQLLVDQPKYDLTNAGVASFKELRGKMKNPQDPSLKICFVGARAEMYYPTKVWRELSYSFPNVYLSVLMVGPEIPQKFHHQILEIAPNLVICCYKQMYHEIHDELIASDFVPDLYVGLNSGLGYEGYHGSWLPTLSYIFETKRPFLLTSHSKEDEEREVGFLQTIEDQYEWLMHQQNNRFKSLWIDVLSNDVRNMINSNWSMWCIAGK